MGVFPKGDPEEGVTAAGQAERSAVSSDMEVLSVLLGGARWGILVTPGKPPQARHWPRTQAETWPHRGADRTPPSAPTLSYIRRPRGSRKEHVSLALGSASPPQLWPRGLGK